MLLHCRAARESSRLEFGPLYAARKPRQQTAPTSLIGAVSIHFVHRVVKEGDSHIFLTPKEFSLLHYLMAHAGPPIPHSQLLHAVWGFEFTDQVEYLRTYMRQLRQKIEDDVSHPAYLLTEPHFGYRFVAANEWDKAKYVSETKV